MNARNATTAAAPMLDKLVLSHRGALTGKYTAKGLSRIEAALKRLAQADAKRGVRLRIGWLDQPDPAGVAAVARADDARAVKRAVDAWFKALQQPDYLLILGGPDVVPHQPLRNPLAGQDDEEAVVPSDLPYACDRAYSLDAAQFLGPSRVVGRLPDVPGAADVGYLLGLIDRAASAAPLKNRKYFGLSAQVWRAATEHNLRIGLGVAGAGAVDLHCSPTLGPKWTKPQLNRSIHLINCHGNPQFAGFSGEDAGGAGLYPLAIDPGSIKQRIAANAVIAAECCYGAELYAPDAFVPMGMALSYLGEGAAAFLGSSTIAYGGFGAADASDADVLCAQFLAQVGQGASSGSALLAARQHLLRESPKPTPFEVKTLAQFMLLGDPAYRAFPAANAAPVAAVAGKARKSMPMAMALPMTAAAPGVEGVVDHRSRRKALTRFGATLKREVVALNEPVAPTVSAADLTAGLSLPGLGAGPTRVIQFASASASVSTLSIDALAPELPTLRAIGRNFGAGPVRLLGDMNARIGAPTDAEVERGSVGGDGEALVRVFDDAAPAISPGVVKRIEPRGQESIAIAVQERVLPSREAVGEAVAARPPSRSKSAKGAKAAKAAAPARAAEVRNRVFVVARLIDGQVVSRKVLSTR